MLEEKDSSANRIFPITRRRFVQGLAAAGAIAAVDRRAWCAFAQDTPHTQPALSGTHFDLAIDTLPVNFTGRRRLATSVNGSVPGPTLRWREGDTITIAVKNQFPGMECACPRIWMECRG
jgi:FtsP/CotA-like multicopper oxidase with cupredoxin domain